MELAAGAGGAVLPHLEDTATSVDLLVIAGHLAGSQAVGGPGLRTCGGAGEGEAGEERENGTAAAHGVPWVLAVLLLQWAAPPFGGSGTFTFDGGFFSSSLRR